MVHRYRHDYIELSCIYLVAVIAVVALSSVAVPVSVSKLGIISSSEKEKIISMYNTKSFDTISVQAKAYVVYDIVEKKIVSGKNENDVLPLASLTKIMTAVTALSHNDKNIFIKILPHDIDGGYDLGLIKNQVWTLEELLKYTLVFSSNDGAITIADTLGGTKTFVNQMNDDAVLLGLTTLHFNHPAGLDVGSILGGQGSALDTAKLFSIARRRFPEILDATTHTRVNVNASTGKVIGIPNTNQDIEGLFIAEGSKTGFTDIAGGNLAVVVDITVGHPVVIVVLGSTRDGRFSDVEILFEALEKSLE